MPTNKVFYFCNTFCSMPRQSGLAANNPRREAMMKKLVVTVFALSLTALGCGSDDGGKKDAAPKMDTLPGVEVQAPIPDAPWGPEVQAPGVEAGQPDTKPAIDQAVDQASPTDVPMDQAVPMDAGTPDTNMGVDMSPVTVDGGAIDAQETEAGPAIDGGMDSGSAG